MAPDRYRQTNGHGPGVLERTREEARFFWSDLTDAKDDLQELAAKEVELLRAEFDEQRSVVLRAALFGVMALTVGFLFAAFLAVTLMFALDSFMDATLAALITALVLGAIAGTAAFVGYSTLKRFSPLPRRTINSLKEDAEWAKTLMSSSKR
jgi:uncharacterized membrane protein YqjE